jgi:hypothetical protein
VNQDNGNIRHLGSGELPRTREVLLKPQEAAHLEQLPAEERPAAYRTMQLGEALKLVKQVRDITNVQLKVFRMNDRDMVASITRDRAMDWYHANVDLPLSKPVKEMGLHTEVATPDGPFPLWYLVADHFRLVLAGWTPGPRLPDEMLAPFLIYSTDAPAGEGGEG